MQVNHGKSRIGAFTAGVAITTADVQIIIRKNGSTAAVDLSGVAQGTVRVDPDDTNVAHFQYGTDSLAPGDTVTEIIRSIGGNFPTQVNTVHVLSSVTVSQLVEIQGSGTCACGGSKAVLLN